jgi:D-alanine--poly(phosphoribitol) ligase subunit 1
MNAIDTVDRFLAVAAAAPDHRAVVEGQRSYSYGELEIMARRFAAGVGASGSQRVLIGLPQGAMAYAAMLGAGMAGACYTPVNLSAPLSKLRRVAALLQPDLIVADMELGAQLGHGSPSSKLISPGELAEFTPLQGSGSRHRLAYILFTSGSTGTPKGVMIPRQALDHYVRWIGDAMGIGPEDRVAQHPNVAFDLSVVDIYGSLCYGATCFPVSERGDQLMPARMIGREQITVWNSVPSVVALMMQARQATARNLNSLRLLNFCGEPLLREHLDAIFAACPTAEVLNTYGPTEATVSVTELRLNATNYAKHVQNSVALGRAIAGMGIHLVGGVDSSRGEIVITGPQLAEGYWQDPAKTAAAFRELNVGGLSVRAYYTGDVGEWINDDLYFRERIDFQVKVNGFRLELDEVAQAIRDCGWPVVCVVKVADELAALIERVPGRVLDQSALQLELAGRIEKHAIPSYIREVARMPRNDNDKIDRTAAAEWLSSQLAETNQ